MAITVKFFEDTVCQQKKTGYSVCGDYYLSERTEEGSLFILCDGIGSGIYANIAAITCAERLLELVRERVSLRAACEMVASSMHKAREADIPFSAFSALEVLPDGHFWVYTYEAPDAIVFRNGSASVLSPRFYTAGYEVIGESFGKLTYGDAILLSSDGVTQAGLGHGYGMGIGTAGVIKFINHTHVEEEDINLLPEKIAAMCSSFMQNRFEDDTSVALIHCREARQLSILTGPPSKPSLDSECVNFFMSLPGQKIVCGSTTADIVSRELGRKVELVNMSPTPGALPEYCMEGIDLTTEGAITLNQVYNILDEPPETLSQNSNVEYFCLLLLQADVINFIVGTTVNHAHEDLIFKQAGVRTRKTMTTLLIEKLCSLGKLVIERNF
jgi:serine/threonine protein phosphatase PrpC